MENAIPGPWNISRAEYFADTEHMAHHMLECWRCSIEGFVGRYVNGTIEEETSSTALRFGNAFHCMMLEPVRFASDYKITPAGVSERTKAFTTILECSQEVVTFEEHDTLKAMRESCLAHPFARQALEDAGHVEKVIRWVCPDTGIKKKALIDKLFTAGQSKGLLADIKTISDERWGVPRDRTDAWQAAVASYGYHRQAAHYLEGAWEVYQADGPLVFIVVGKQPPFITSCHVLDEAALMLGREQNHKALMELAERKASNDWKGRLDGKVHVTSLPRWAFS